jgi:hypothetical protein
MAISAHAVGYGALAVLGAILLAAGAPQVRAQQAPAVAAPATHPAPSPSVASGNGVTLRSVSVEFPTSESSFPGGAAAEAITNNCTACHSPGMVLNQPALTPAQWQAEVNHMRKDFKAPIADADVPTIVAYLVSTKGAK